MLASPFNAMHATAVPVACSVRAFLDEAGEAHGRAIMALAINRVPILDEAVVEIIRAEGRRMATIYAEAGCSRRQVQAFVSAYFRGATARNAEAMALLAQPHDGSA